MNIHNSIKNLILVILLGLKGWKVEKLNVPWILFNATASWSRGDLKCFYSFIIFKELETTQEKLIFGLICWFIFYKRIQDRRHIINRRLVINRMYLGCWSSLFCRSELLPCVKVRLFLLLRIKHWRFTYYLSNPSTILLSWGYWISEASKPLPTGVTRRLKHPTLLKRIPSWGFGEMEFFSSWVRGFLGTEDGVMWQWHLHCCTLWALNSPTVCWLTDG